MLQQKMGLANRHVCVHAKCMLQGDDDGEMTSEIERKFEITAEKAHEVLRRMSDEDCEALGFNIRFSRPDWMILTVLPVPPPPVRPSVMMDSSARYAPLPSMRHDEASLLDRSRV